MSVITITTFKYKGLDMGNPETIVPNYFIHHINGQMLQKMHQKNEKGMYMSQGHIKAKAYVKRHLNNSLVFSMKTGSTRK